MPPPLTHAPAPAQTSGAASRRRPPCTQGGQGALRAARGGRPVGTRRVCGVGVGGGVEQLCDDVAVAGLGRHVEGAPAVLRGRGDEGVEGMRGSRGGCVGAAMAAIAQRRAAMARRPGERRGPAAPAAGGDRRMTAVSAVTAVKRTLPGAAWPGTCPPLARAHTHSAEGPRGSGGGGRTDRRRRRLRRRDGPARGGGEGGGTRGHRGGAVHGGGGVEQQAKDVAVAGLGRYAEGGPVLRVVCVREMGPGEAGLFE